MSFSPAVDAARHFLSIVWDSDPPGDEALAECLDRLASAYHLTPERAPADGDLAPQREDGTGLYEAAAARFPDYGIYPIADPSGSFDDTLMAGDAIDDIADITRDMREVLWRFEHLGSEDAEWLFRLQFLHWGQHARDLALYLHARLFP